MPGVEVRGVRARARGGRQIRSLGGPPSLLTTLPPSPSLLPLPSHPVLLFTPQWRPVSSGSSPCTSEEGPWSSAIDAPLCLLSPPPQLPLHRRFHHLTSSSFIDLFFCCLLLSSTRSPLTRLPEDRGFVFCLLPYS